jgi:hypothetical protein
MLRRARTLREQHEALNLARHGDYVVRICVAIWRSLISATATVFRLSLAIRTGRTTN